MPKLVNNFLDSNQHYYHVFNKTLDNKQIFLDPIYCKIFLNTLEYYNNNNHKVSYSIFLNLPVESQKRYLDTHVGEKRVNFYSFNLLPNHYHLLCRENDFRTLSILISNVINSFTRHYNLIKSREGALFKRGYKKTLVTTEEQFLHLLRYINLNGVSSGLVKIEELKDNNFCSYKFLLNKLPHNLCDFEKVYELFTDSNDFETFITDAVDYQKSLYLIKQDLKSMGIKFETAL